MLQQTTWEPLCTVPCICILKNVGNVAARQEVHALELPMQRAGRAGTTRVRCRRVLGVHIIPWGWPASLTLFCHSLVCTSFPGAAFPVSAPSNTTNTKLVHEPKLSDK